ncbi:hypothetical protein Calab_0630 [Caldithrix abyssi DSM 13497]|uniref:AAA domain-containing protein n=1 Tax=Caldithrix abyssi DSM 13497 TaxID=880073 RepID=H1XSA9_CALAY|nr:AAA family ATPase [Caldithrix abyssi]APF20215.1 AAA domain-containing protein [Caldithrix abyssi DSM 13497]EHO40273.1 hypothetical protein Calab_0630 [Caldithrix abyssi DSM 13497]
MKIIQFFSFKQIRKAKTIFVRSLFQILVDNIDSKQAIIVTGARQVGKTTLLKQFLNFLPPTSITLYLSRGTAPPAEDTTYWQI